MRVYLDKTDHRLLCHHGTGSRVLARDYLAREQGFDGANGGSELSLDGSGRGSAGLRRRRCGLSG